MVAGGPNHEFRVSDAILINDFAAHQASLLGGNNDYEDLGSIQEPLEFYPYGVWEGFVPMTGHGVAIHGTGLQAMTMWRAGHFRAVPDPQPPPPPAELNPAPHDPPGPPDDDNINFGGDGGADGGAAGGNTGGNSSGDAGGDAAGSSNQGDQDRGWQDNNWWGSSRWSGGWSDNSWRAEPVQREPPPLPQDQEGGESPQNKKNVTTSADADIPPPPVPEAKRFCKGGSVRLHLPWVRELSDGERKRGWSNSTHHNRAHREAWFTIPLPKTQTNEESEAQRHEFHRGILRCPRHSPEIKQEILNPFSFNRDVEDRLLPLHQVTRWNCSLASAGCRLGACMTHCSRPRELPHYPHCCYMCCNHHKEFFESRPETNPHDVVIDMTDSNDDRYHTEACNQRNRCLLAVRQNIYNPLSTQLLLARTFLGHLADTNDQ